MAEPKYKVISLEDLDEIFTAIANRINGVEKKITDSGVSGLTSRVQKLETDYSTLSQKAQTAATDAASAKSDASNAAASASSANTNAAEAISTANSAKTTADSAKQTADSAASSAASAASAASKAQNTADTANTAAGVAQQTANAAKAAVDKMPQVTDEMKSDGKGYLLVNGSYDDVFPANCTPLYYPQATAQSIAENSLKEGRMVIPHDATPEMIEEVIEILGEDIFADLSASAPSTLELHPEPSFEERIEALKKQFLENKAQMAEMQRIQAERQAFYDANGYWPEEASETGKVSKDVEPSKSE